MPKLQEKTCVPVMEEEYTEKKKKKKKKKKREKKKKNVLDERANAIML